MDFSIRQDALFFPQLNLPGLDGGLQEADGVQLNLVGVGGKERRAGHTQGRGA